MKTIMKSKVKYEITGVVSYCGCNGQAEKIHGHNESGDLLPCPNPKKVINLGNLNRWGFRHPLLWLKIKVGRN